VTTAVRFHVNNEDFERLSSLQYDQSLTSPISYRYEVKFAREESVEAIEIHSYYVNGIDMKLHSEDDSKLFLRQILTQSPSKSSTLVEFADIYVGKGLTVELAVRDLSFQPLRCSFSFFAPDDDSRVKQMSSSHHKILNEAKALRIAESSGQ
jgi:hypothetical protein